MVYGVIALGGRDIIQRAKTFTGLESMSYSIRSEEKEKEGFGVKLASPTVTEGYRTRIEEIEELMKIGEAYLRKQKEEYKKLIESNNNENH